MSPIVLPDRNAGCHGRCQADDYGLADSGHTPRILSFRDKGVLSTAPFDMKPYLQSDRRFEHRIVMPWRHRLAAGVTFSPPSYPLSLRLFGIYLGPLPSESNNADQVLYVRQHQFFTG